MSKGRAGELPRRPLRDRRARLEDVVAGSELVFPVRRLAPNGLVVWQQVVERRYEGYVAKDETSAYESGRTTRCLKVKQTVSGGPLEAADRRGAAGPLIVASRGHARLAVGSPMVSLLTELDAFYTEHRDYGELDGAVEADRIWLTCSCGAAINRNADRD